MSKGKEIFKAAIDRYDKWVACIEKLDHPGEIESFHQLEGNGRDKDKDSNISSSGKASHVTHKPSHIVTSEYNIMMRVFGHDFGEAKKVFLPVVTGHLAEIDEAVSFCISA